MNRRGFFKGLAAAALCATANAYGLLPLPYRGSRFSWDKGLEVADASTLIEHMRKAIHEMPNLSQGRPVFYMGREVYEKLCQIADSA